MCYFATVLCFIFVSWKLFTTVATSPYHVFVPSKVSMLKLMLYLGSLRRNSIAVCHESGHSSLQKIQKNLPIYERDPQICTQLSLVLSFSI
jgi:hypothetical protein